MHPLVCAHVIAKKLWGDAEAFEIFVTFIFLSSAALSPLTQLNVMLGPG